MGNSNDTYRRSGKGYSREQQHESTLSPSEGAAARAANSQVNARWEAQKDARKAEQANIYGDTGEGWFARFISRILD